MKLKIRYHLLFLLIVVSSNACNKIPDNGVSLQLAKERKELFSSIEYTLHFSIPQSRSEKIRGRIDINFNSVQSSDVVIDFRENASNIKTVYNGKNPVKYQFKNGHIFVPKKYIKRGNNRISVDFFAGEGSLNRKADFLYTLFVPDRASTAFPCFDQPDLKAVYNLTLDIPGAWTAVTNGKLIKSVLKDSTKTLTFGPTKSLSSYLFAFVAGRFDTISRSENGRIITMYHRENDSLKVARNIDAIFSSHFHSLTWLKEYTEIDYPFGKLDIILIPDFQYNGMEHAGAIYYRDSRLLLDEKPSITQQLGQANLIAHEVSHQWFGDLVTMRWFNDVWLKEVFAGFMADKIINPQYPDIDHDLNFLLSHYPRAYSVDRTPGANPIRQDLENLLFAGTIYGDIIYHKAPVMMMQLELLMGKEIFKKGIRQYLETFKMNNADWEELVAILDPLTLKDLESWSNAWVDKPGMPVIISINNLNREGDYSGYRLIQSKKESKSSIMGMKIGLSRFFPDKKEEYNIEMTGDTTEVPIPSGPTSNNWILPNSDGKGYGLFYPDSLSLNSLLNSTTVINDNLSRSSWYVMANELFLHGVIDSEKYYTLLVSNILAETESQTRQYLLNVLEIVWWNFFSPEQRKINSIHLERSLFQLLTSKNIKENEQKPIFWTFTRIALTEDAKIKIYKVWNNEKELPGVKLDESDYMVLACELAVRNFNNSDSILKVQENRIINTDRLAKFRFIKKAVSSDSIVRDSFFISLYDPANRRPEPWVTEALRYFHHPLRADYSIKYLKPALDLLPEIQRTGDIFFPKSWLDVTLSGYNSEQAFSIVDTWLKNNQALPVTLRDKVMQSSDNMRRATVKNF